MGQNQTRNWADVGPCFHLPGLAKGLPPSFDPHPSHGFGFWGFSCGWRQAEVSLSEQPGRGRWRKCRWCLTGDVPNPGAPGPRSARARQKKGATTWIFLQVQPDDRDETGILQLVEIDGPTRNVAEPNWQTCG